jgi:uncharacterized protein YkwD
VGVKEIKVTMKNQQQDQAVNDRKVRWVPVPVGPLEKAMVDKSLDGKTCEEIRGAIRSLKGPMRLQEDAKGLHWLVYHEDVVEGFVGLYTGLGLIENDFDLLEVLKLGGLMEIAVITETGGLALSESQIPKDKAFRSVVSKTAAEYGFEDEGLVNQVLHSFIIHSVDFVEGLGDLAPKIESEFVLTFLKKSTELFRKQAAGETEILRAMGGLWASGGHRRAQKALIQKLESLERETGESSRESRLRKLALKSSRKEGSANYLRDILPSSRRKARPGARPIAPVRGESGRKLRRNARSGSARKRQAKRRSRMRSRRLVAWSASGIDALPTALREELKVKVESKSTAQKKAETKKAQKKPEAKARTAKAPRTEKTRKDKATAEARKRARRKQQSEKDCEGKTKARRKARSKQQTRMRSQRLTVWSASADDLGIAPVKKAELRKAYDEKVKAKKQTAKKADERTAEAKVAPTKTTRKERPAKKAKKEEKRSKKRTRKAAKGAGRKRKSRRLTAMKSRQLATWSASQEMEALPDSTKKKLKAELFSDQQNIVKDKATDVAAASRGKKRSKNSRSAKGRARGRSAGAGGGRKKRRKKQGLKRASQSLAVWSASQELEALPRDTKKELAAALTPSTTDPVKEKKVSASKGKTTATSPKKATAVTRTTGGKRRRSGAPKGVQQLVMAGAAVAMLFFLFLIVSSIDSAASARDLLEKEVAALSIQDGYAKHKEWLDYANDFKGINRESKDQTFADEMISAIEEKRDASVQKLSQDAQATIALPLDSREEQRKAAKLLLRIGSWKAADKTRLERKDNDLREALQMARNWSDLGEEILDIAKRASGGSDLELHNIFSDDSPKAEDRELAESFQNEAKIAEEAGVAKILQLVSKAYYHPALDAESYDKLEIKAMQGTAKGYSEARKEILRKFSAACMRNKALAMEYKRVMTAAYVRLEKEDLEGAKAIVQGSAKARDYWFKQALAWLSGSQGKEWLEGMKARPEPEIEEITRNPEPEEVNPQPEEKKGPIITQKEDKRTYKESFAQKLYQYKSAKGGGKSVLASEMAKVMKDSLSLVKGSPAMAYDVVRFYKERKAKFIKEVELKELYRQHVEKAFATIFPTVTGPNGFRRLNDWCKANNYKNGSAELKPILAKFNPPDGKNGNYIREITARRKSAKVKDIVGTFLSKRRVANVKAFRKLLSFLREEGYMEDEVKDDFIKNVNLIVGKVGKDRRLAQKLIENLGHIPTRDHSARKKEKLRKSYFSKSMKLHSEAENDLIDAVVKALKAKEPGVGYDILQDALVINPRSERAFKGLKYKKVGDEWIRPWDADMRNKGFKYDNDIGWYKGEKQEGKYYSRDTKSWQDLAAANATHAEASTPWILNSEHFTLNSCASLKESQLVVRRLEAFYLRLFRQFDLFFAPNGNAVVVFGLATKAHMVVNYYRDRAQFQASANPPTDWAAGFYSGGRKASFFYSTPGSWTVLQHEVVHQILGENSRGHANSWLAEGTAVYMEDAYFNRDGKLLLGPVAKHHRPYRYLTEAQNGRTTISFDEVLALKTSAQWGAGNIGDHYKGAGSVVYFFMTFDGGRYRGTFLNYLRGCYSGVAGSELTNYFGLSQATLGWLCERFYKQGFVYHNGQMMTHEEKMVYDREYIEQFFPDPDPKAFKKARGRGNQYSSEVKKLVRTLKSNPNMDRRRQAAEALASIGDEGKKALDETLGTLIEKAKSAVVKQIKSKKAAYRAKLAAEILRRRREAYDFIMDPSKYPDANHGAAAQPDVDKLVNALRNAFKNPYAVLKVEEKKLKEMVDKMNLYHDWRKELLGIEGNKKKDNEEIAKKVKDTLKMDQIPLSKADAQIKKLNEGVLAYNKRGKFLLNKEERDCCEKTNEYRMMFGLKALKFFDPLVRAARGHSKEMQELKYFDHTSPTPANRSPAMRCSRQGAKYSGENIAMGHPTGLAAFWGWYNSSGHHRNILGKTHLSIGVGQAARYWTQNFGRDNP